MTELNCLLEDGTVDLDKVAKAAELMKQYRVLCEVANAIYDGHYDRERVAIHIKLQPPSYVKDEKDSFGRAYPRGERIISVTSSDIDSLIRNKATVLKDKIEELGFSTRKSK
jgi:hypothetical protein